MRYGLFLFIAVCLLGVPLWAAPQPVLTAKATLASPFVWSDEKAQIHIETPSTDGQVAYTLKVLTRYGWEPTSEGVAPLQNGQLEITPQGEGIHVVTLQNPAVELRFLALRPVPTFTPVERAALHRTLPQRADKLLSGQPFTILAMGDSVTATGDYARLLSMMLARATGNQNISVVKRAYSGRSVDATVRHWPDDTRDIAPDLGLLMYGLNDQVTFYPLDAYLEQYQWVADHLKSEFGADTVFLQPTPDLSFPWDEAAKKPDSNSADFAFRTIGFGEALRPLASELKIPLAETFAAIWGAGGPSIEEAARRLAPLYPPGYAKQFNSLLETGNKGDTIHLNALGHLTLARAVFEALTEEKIASPLAFSAQSRWTKDGVQSLLTVKNVGTERRRGRLEVHPLLRGELQSTPLVYDLAPGQSAQCEVAWPQAKVPGDLLKFPNDHYLAPGRPLLPVLDYANDSSHVYAIAAPFEVPTTYVRERQIVAPGAGASLRLTGEAKPHIAVRMEDDMVGAIPLIKKVEANGRTGWAVAEFRYTCFGQARDGEAQVDGELNEWEGQSWSPVGEPSQARYSSGPRDFRATPHEAYLHWAFKAGRDGLYAAARGEGQVSKDNFTLFFDPREPQELGSVGRYYWVRGQLKDDGQIQMRKGETSRDAPEMRGVWKASAEGLNLELFVPYSLFERASWPASGDLGCSIWWVHVGADGQRTNLMWSEEGHPWNTRWYGVIRRTENAASLPFMVRVK